MVRSPVAKTAHYNWFGGGLNHQLWLGGVGANSDSSQGGIYGRIMGELGCVIYIE